MRTALDLVQTWYSATLARDRATLRGLLHQDVEFIVADGYPSGGRYVGPSAVFDDFFPKSFRAWRVLVPEVDEIFAVSGEAVTVRGRYVGRTKATDTPFDVPFAHLWKARDGKLVWLQQYLDTAVLRDAVEGRARAGRTEGLGEPVTRIGGAAKTGDE